MAAPRPGSTEPFGRVLVPIDFSTGAFQAIRRALLLPLARTATVSLVHVLPRGLPRNARGAVLARARRALDRLVVAVRNRPGGCTLELAAELLTGEPFVEIIRRARELRAELVVLGRHGRQPVRDMFIGTTATRVIRKGDVPVLVVSRRPERAYRRPLIATAREDVAAQLLDLALRVLGPGARTVGVVHAFSVPFEGFIGPALSGRETNEYRRSLQKEARASLASLLAKYQRPGLRWRTTVRRGDARTVILAEALRRRSDLVALGTHGRAGAAHALLGSVAEWVLAAAPCDVLVARPVRFSFELP